MYLLDRSFKYDVVILKCFDMLIKWYIFFVCKIYFGFLCIGRLLNCSFKKKNSYVKIMNKKFGKCFMCLKKYFELYSCKIINLVICKIDILCLFREC